MCRRTVLILFFLFLGLGPITVHAWDAKKRLVYFEAANQAAKICGRLDLYQNLLDRASAEKREMIDALYDEGVRNGLSDVDAKVYVVLAANEARRKVLGEYVPDLERNRIQTCNALERRFAIFYELISRR